MPGIVCQRIRVTGVVQGVGYRPFVWRLANELELHGWVRNTGGGVEIEVCGKPPQVNALIERLSREAPPLARVDDVRAHPAERKGDAAAEFVILDSDGGPATTTIGHDTAICADCLGELFDPKSRRWRYAFTNCTHCGPRYTISRGIPYDRARTALAPFPLCRDCRQEYERPADRRFHAEANCCAKCGPRLTLLDESGAEIAGDPLAKTLTLLRQGGIVAIKGLGGFHLVCDARNAEAVSALRERKAREEKPFAVMVANLASASSLVQVGIGEPALLEAAERPIVLMKKRHAADERLPGVAPGMAWLGLMLPYTPLHYLLFHEAAGRPAGTAWLSRPQELALVMTSANPGGEPLVTGNDEALLRLSEIADAYLIHDRDIVVRCDDSVLRAAPGGFQFLRRARGFTPRAIRLPYPGPATLAVGGWFKNTVCVTRGNEAFVSQHIGDLDNAATCSFFEETVAHLLAVLQVKPERVAHDLHPDFHSTRFAADYARMRGLPAIAVQHHHAHLAAVLAEHGIRDATIGLALDGVGLGSDGGAWGGELLHAARRSCRRLGSLRPLPLPGGDRAAREPWRMAAAVLHRLGRADEIERRFADQPAATMLGQLLERGVNCPPSSSLGRWFDAAAGLLGVCRTMAFEGQAAMLLEGLAERYGEMLPIDHGWRIDGGELDLTPLLAVLADETNPGRGAAVFHATLAAALADWVRGFADGGRVLGAGGCFLNQVLVRGLRSRLATHGLTLVEAQRLPPNDGGLALGQAWVAMNSDIEEH
ncbi:carbamoyltransferase HypF [Azospira restricta]|uniref:Carbamoyltransferase HypF n=1 Tax=Azospira restricta TaxID=404405 RepID=A0A974Y4U2_9RHOO|nr:carbamoyltransferase HypF [Azospira restricta]QRJ64716.1 carbamoyltransferase HypF [Azospira restricta]